MKFNHFKEITDGIKIPFHLKNQLKQNIIKFFKKLNNRLPVHQKRVLLVQFLLLITVFLTFASCYSVRFRNENGSPMLDPFSNRDDYYRGMSVVEIDTIINLKFTSRDFTYRIKENDTCQSGKLNIIEYRNTLGSFLLNATTFGRKRKIKIKYVCEKPKN